MTYRRRICPKCGGMGELPQYSHVEGGVCFLCNGTGFLEDVVDSTDDVIVANREADTAFVLDRLTSSQKALQSNKDMCRIEDPQDVFIMAARSNALAELTRLDRKSTR